MRFTNKPIKSIFKNSNRNIKKEVDGKKKKKKFFLKYVLKSKKTITTEEWKKKLDQVKISKKELDKIVMNYLVVEGYQEAAEMFQKESKTPSIYF